MQTADHSVQPPGRPGHQHGALSRRRRSVDRPWQQQRAALHRCRRRRSSTSARRPHEGAGEVPTAAEPGLPGFVFNSWYGVWAPRGLQHTVAHEDVRRQFTNVGTVPTFDGPAAFTAFMARDIQRNVALLRAAKFEPE